MNISKKKIKPMKKATQKTPKQLVKYQHIITILFMFVIINKIKWIKLFIFN